MGKNANGRTFAQQVLRHWLIPYHNPCTLWQDRTEQRVREARSFSPALSRGRKPTYVPRGQCSNESEIRGNPSPQNGFEGEPKRVTEHLTVCSHNPTVRMHSKLSVKALTRDFDLVTAYQAVRWKMQCYLRQITTELTCL